jgi:hypothetical protein
MVDDACYALGISNPLPRSAGVHRLRELAPAVCVRPDPAPGCIGCHDSGGGRGHAGIVVEVHYGTPGYLVVVEANTNPAGSRDGDGVYLRTRPLDYYGLGFIDASAAAVLTPPTTIS